MSRETNRDTNTDIHKKDRDTETGIVYIPSLQSFDFSKLPKLGVYNIDSRVNI